MLTRVVRDEGLAADPRYGGPRPGGRLGGLLAGLMGRKPALPSTPEHYAVGTLFRALKVERSGKGYVLSIAVAAPEPHLAARLANAVAAAFVADQRDARLETARREAAFFAERLGPLGEHLRGSEDALDGFRRVHGLTATGAAATSRPGTLNEQQLGDLTTRLAQARVDTAQAWARFDGARGTVAHGQGMEAIPDVVRSPLIVQLRQQQSEASRREAELAARYNEGYPALTTARAERREVGHAGRPVSTRPGRGTQSMKARLLGGIGANLYAQGVTAVVQLASVPLLVAAWGPARFGRWSLLTAIPAALAFADGGLVLAGGASMAMLAAQGRHPVAAALFRRMLRRVAAAMLGLALLAGLTIAMVPDAALPTPF
ncbi:hypothetical protein P7D22_20400, partial [Lichenihabitans sp. Uapishka_5]|nr:hypothetical protein [Lichenihabitans sp. Uapishka_5]